MKALCVQSTGPQGRNPDDGSFFGPLIDDVQFCRYRFTPAEEGMGSASVLQGLAYTCNLMEVDKMMVSTATSLHYILLRQGAHPALTRASCLERRALLSACPAEGHPLPLCTSGSGMS